MYKKDTLKNGLRVITSAMPHMESVSIGVWIGVGGRYESKKRCGVSHLLEHMLFKGTKTRNANALKEAIEGVGGSFNGFTSEELTCYLVKLPASHVKLGLDILSDMVLNPKLDPIELEKEKYVICEEIKMYMDQPSHYVFDVLSEAMWPGHALGRPIAGYIDSVKKFKRDDVVRFKDEFYRPANMALVSAGKIDRNKILKLAGEAFHGPSAKMVSAFELVRENDRGNKLSLFHKDTKQMHLALGFHGIKRTHKLRYALGLLNVILGGNMSSRLFDKLRDEKALCYDISSGVRRYKETGAFVIHAGVDKSKLMEASVEIMHELKNIKENPVTRDELYRAKEYSRGQFLMALEDTSSRMLWLGERLMEEASAPSVEEMFKKIDKVTADEIRKVANIIFTGENLNFATVGPAWKNIKKDLERILVL